MNAKRKSIFLIICLTLNLSTLVAQTAPDGAGANKAGGSDEEARKQLERKAYTLLDEVIGGIGSLRVPENQALLQTRAAALLWSQDEKRARALFTDALNNLSAAARNLNDDTEERNRSFWSFFQLRQQLIMIVARYDAGLALDLLRATRQKFPSGMPDMERDMEQNLAAQAAASDPKRALQIAIESLAKGISQNAVNTVFSLAAKDKDAAAKLYGEIVRQLAATNFTMKPEAANAAINLLQISAQSRSNAPTTDGRAGASGNAPFAPDPQIVRELVNVLVTAASSASPGSPLIMMLPSAMSEIEKYAPERVQQLRRKIAESERIREAQGDRSGLWNQYRSLLENGTPEALIEAAAKASPEMRSALYGRAVMSVLGKGDVERARQIANDNIQDSSMREQMLSYINRTALERAAMQGKLEEAQQLAAQIRSTEERATALARLAAQTNERGDRKAALRLLEEAQRLVGGRAKRPEQIAAQLQVARAYALLDPTRSFEIVDSIVDQTNEMIAAAAVLNGFINNQQLFREGELILRPEFVSNPMLGGNYLRELGALARADFSRARSTADRFAQSETRLMARLLVVEGALSKEAENGPNAVSFGRARLGFITR